MSGDIVVNVWWKVVDGWMGGEVLVEVWCRVGVEWRSGLLLHADSVYNKYCSNWCEIRC